MNQIINTDGDVRLYSGFVTEAAADDLFSALETSIDWRQDVIRIYGRSIAIPRLTAWHGDPGKSYRYSGITMQPQPWTPDLWLLREKLRQFLGQDFNSVLLNYYRTGSDRVGWHSDDERDLVHNAAIATISLGTIRRFLLRHKAQKEDKIDISLNAGSLLVMQGPTQQYWQHSVPPAKRITTPRISLTFRVIR